MDTSDTIFNLDSDRSARIAISASIAVSVAFLSLTSLIPPAFATESISLAAIMEILVVFIQVISAVSGMIVIFQGKVEPGVWRLIYSFLAAGIFRVLMRETIGVPVGLMTAIVVSTTAYLALPARNASRGALLGYGVGGAIIIFDLYAANFYGRQPASDALITASRNLAIFIFFTQIIVLVSQGGTLSFASKIAGYFSLLTLFAVTMVGFAGIQALSSQIATGSDVTGFVQFTLTILERWTIITGVLVSFLSAALGVWIARTLTSPLGRLSEASRLIAAGNLDTRAPITAADEIGELATSFNSMADSMKGLVGQLEIHVEERTKDLQRRAQGTQAAVEIGRIVTSMRDLKSLLDRTAQLITERFGFYHAGIFLINETREYAVLHAASSEGGSKMLEHGHKLKVGETGIVGFVAQAGQARIALDVGQDAVFFDNPNLPDTRSEMALPLIAGGIVLGALDVQSTESQAFNEQDIATLRILADQLAIAIENARLFDETQSALEAARMAYGEISREAWSKTIRNQPRVSYVAAQLGSVHPNNNPPSTDIVRAIESGDEILHDDGRTIAIPIKVRGQPIGALRLRKQETAAGWTQEEAALAASLSGQLSGALESARLYKESQQRATRESLVSDISARISALPRVDTILRETVQELGRAIGDTSVTFQLLEMPEAADQLQGTTKGNGNSADQEKL